MPTANATLQHQLLHATVFLERFCYYGMRALLVLYLINQLALTNADALSYYGTFTAAVFMFTLPAGLLSDMVFNRRNGAIIGLVFNLLGYLLLLGGSLPLTFLAMGCIAIGGAFFKTSVIALLSQYYPRTSAKYTGVFFLNYLWVNFGAFLGVLIISAIGAGSAYLMGFGAVCLLMAATLGIMIWATKLGDHHAETIAGQDNFNTDDHPTILDAPIINKRVAAPKLSTFHYVMLVALPFFSGLFWVAFEEVGDLFYLANEGSTIEILGIPLPYYTLTSIFTLISCFVFFLYLQNKDTFSNLKSIGIGFLIMLFALIIAYSLKGKISEGLPTSSNLLGLFLLLEGIAEVFIVPVGFAFMTRISPPKFTATFVGLYLFVIGAMIELFSTMKEMTGIEHSSSSVVVFIVLFLIIGSGLLVIYYTQRKRLNGID